MLHYKATEFEVRDREIVTTGRVAYYTAPSIRAAVKQVAYTQGLSDGRTKIGPTGRVVYTGGMGWAVTPDR